MFYLIGFIIVFVAVTVFTFKTEPFDEFGASIAGLLISLISLIPLCIIGLVVCSIVEANQNNYYYETKDTKIYSLEVGNQIDGSFILGCGGVDNNINYYFYKKDENDLYELDEINSRFCKLKLNDEIEPCIRKTYKKYKNEFLDTLFNLGATDSTIIIVPTTAIKQVYNGMVNG